MAHGPDTEELLRKITEIINDETDNLNLWSLNITSLPPDLPYNLKVLNCANIPITALPDLPSGLQALICYKTLLTALPELPPSLQYLDCPCTPLILQRATGESIPDYNRRWRAWREEQVVKKRAQERCAIIKEELVAAAWAPKRVEKWLEVGGFELLEAL